MKKDGVCLGSKRGRGKREIGRRSTFVCLAKPRAKGALRTTKRDAENSGKRLGGGGRDGEIPPGRVFRAVDVLTTESEFYHPASSRAREEVG